MMKSMRVLRPCFRNAASLTAVGAAGLITTEEGKFSRMDCMEKPGWHILNYDGEKLIKWGAEQVKEWRSTRTLKRSYENEVLVKIRAWQASGRFEVEQAGALSHDHQGRPVGHVPRYPVYAVRTHNWSIAKPCVLITGGVHGYEKSGVQGALKFIEDEAEHYASLGFNIMVVPCVNPWGYETIQRWTAKGVDPNRSFNPNGEVVPSRKLNPEPETEESRILIDLLERMMEEHEVKHWLLHVDCHETTDTDASEFGPSKAARDGAFVHSEVFGPGGDGDPETIPDGFYVYVDEGTVPEQNGFYAAMLNAVKEVTHIAPAGKFDIEDTPNATEFGLNGMGGAVICEAREDETIGACAGVTFHSDNRTIGPKYFTTTEVYPDSKSRKVTEDQCNRAQVACITSALNYLLVVEMPKYKTNR